MQARRRQRTHTMHNGSLLIKASTGMILGMACTVGAEGNGKPPHSIKSLELPMATMTSQKYRVNDVNGVLSNRKHVASGSGGNKASKVVIKRNPCTLNIATWNVRTMQRLGKIENVLREMKMNQINILGLCETRWKNNGDYMENGYRIIHSGGNRKQNGVAILLDKHQASKVVKISQISDRLLLVKINSHPVDIVIIQVYMPTSQHRDEEIDDMYEEIEELMKQEKGSDYMVVMGDWNAVVGEGRSGREVGPYGLGTRNSRGDKLVEFCERQSMMTANTWFQLDKRRRYTWKQPGDRARYQIDYIMVKQRYRNSVKKAGSCPGADADTDHCLVKMKTKIQFRPVKIKKSQRKWNLRRLKEASKDFNRDIEKGLQKDGESNVNTHWEQLKKTITESAVKIIGYEKQENTKKPWVTDEMLTKMAERRYWKKINSDEARKNYRKLNNELRRETEKARNSWWRNACTKIEKLEKEGHHDIMYREIKRLIGDKSTDNTHSCIKDANGKVLVSEKCIQRRWVQYIEKLYNNENKPTPKEIPLEDEGKIAEDDKGPEIIRSEIQEAIKQMKKNKAPGKDGIPAEIIKALTGQAIKELENLIIKMYEHGKWPEDFCESIIVPIKKKQHAVECKDHRTLSLICHSSKIMLRILTKRLEKKAYEYIGSNQFGFRSKRGTREAIGVLRTICERSIEYGNDVYVGFVDLEKAFDRVDWRILLDTLMKIGVDWKDRRMIKELYLNQSARIRIQGSVSEKAIIGQGVRQGCPLSPLLFSIYQERLMREAMESVEEGIKIGGDTISEVRFADDQALLADTELGLQRIMERLDQTANKYNMKINIDKTKVMRICKSGSGIININIRGQQLEQVERFKYLGSVIQSNGKSENEIKTRIAMAKTAFTRRKELLTKALDKRIKKRIIKMCIWSVALYASETWTMTQQDKKRLEALEMWIWRKTENINWRDRVTNEEVLRRVEEKREINNMILERKRKWIEQVITKDGLMKEVLEGRMEGKRTRGRPRKTLLDDINNNGYEDLKRRAQHKREL